MSSDYEDSTIPSSTPYVPGFTVAITSHVAPEPFGAEYGWIPRHAAPIQGYPDINRERFALDNPPLETDPPDRVCHHTFTVTESKTLHRHGGPQVVAGYLDGDRSKQRCLKIYDSVFYKLCGSDGYDCSWYADRDYATEHWAYSTLTKTKAVRGMVPKFYGGWTMSLDTRFPGEKRKVRAILLELVPGKSMLDMINSAKDKKGVFDRSRLPPEDFRLRVLKNIFTIESAIYWDAEIIHGDIHPRNIMIKDDGSVVLVDFNLAIVLEFSETRKHAKELHKQTHPKSPIQEHWPFEGYMPSMAEKGGTWGDWIPESWIGNPEKIAEWLLDTWMNDKRYCFSSAFLDSPDHSKRKPKVRAAIERLRKEAVRWDPDPELMARLYPALFRKTREMR